MSVCGRSGERATSTDAYHRGSEQVRGGNYTPRQFFIILPALLFSAQSAGQAFSLSPEVTKAKDAATSIRALLESKPTILVERPMSNRQGLPAINSESLLRLDHLSESRPKIEFDDVSLRYTSQNSTHALDRISFSVHSGETIALVGPSGAGKSTIVALLERFFDVSSGSIKIDGLDLRDHDPTHLRSRIGLVSQDPVFFPGSIRENLALGSCNEANSLQAEYEDACKACGLHDFIRSLPEGYDTDGSSGNSTKLSGGQQQRLAIARALVRNPEILLLDEPTSALDAHSERAVQIALTAASAGRTTLIVAHRLASIRHVDRILVFDHGRLVEMGNHVDLVKEGGLYASMAKAQSLA